MKRDRLGDHTKTNELCYRQIPDLSADLPHPNPVIKLDPIRLHALLNIAYGESES